MREGMTPQKLGLPPQVLAFKASEVLLCLARNLGASKKKSLPCLSWRA